MRSKQNMCTIIEDRYNAIPVLFVKNNDLRIKPIVFLFHKLLNNKASELPLAHSLAKNGYFVVVLDMYGHGDRTESYEITGKYQFNYIFKDVYNTANDVWQIINYLKELNEHSLDFNNIGAVGTSIGGSIALVSSYLINEIKYAVSIVGTCNWEYILNNRTFDSFRFHAHSNPVMDYEKVREYVKKRNPVNNYNSSNIKPILFLNGMLDTTVPITIALEYFNQLKKVFSNYGEEDVLEFKTYSHAGHEVTPEMTRDLIEWLMNMGSK